MTTTLPLTQYISQVDKTSNITRAHMVSHAQACEGEGSLAVLRPSKSLRVENGPEGFIMHALDGTANAR